MLRLWLFLTTMLDSVDERDRGATMVEYGLMVSLIVVAAMGAVYALGGSIAGIFDEIAKAL